MICQGSSPRFITFKEINLFMSLICNFFRVCCSVRSYNLEASKGKSWKGVLEEWLNLLKSLHNPKSFYRSQFLKEVLQYRLFSIT